VSPTELQALRRLLFFTQAEAAAMIAGASERAWKHWEAGARPVPADVAARIRELAAWRESAIRAILEGIDANIARMGGAPASIPLVYYERAVDWQGEPAMWKPHQSACAALVAINERVRLVRFDSVTYANWLGRKADTGSSRATWAAAQ